MQIKKFKEFGRVSVWFWIVIMLLITLVLTVTECFGVLMIAYGVGMLSVGANGTKLDFILPRSEQEIRDEAFSSMTRWMIYDCVVLVANFLWAYLRDEGNMGLYYRELPVLYILFDIQILVYAFWNGIRGFRDNWTSGVATIGISSSRLDWRRILEAIMIVPAIMMVMGSQRKDLKVCFVFMAFFAVTSIIMAADSARCLKPWKIGDFRG